MSPKNTFLKLGIAALVAVATPAWADPIPANFATTEMMMENLGVNTQGLARLLGIDESTDLHATTFTDPDSLSFAFALDPGQSYNGQAVALVGGGAYNTAESRWEGHAVAAAGRAPLFSSDWVFDVASTDPLTGDYVWIAQLDRDGRFEIDAEGRLEVGTDAWGIWSRGYGTLTINGRPIMTVIGWDRIPFFNPWSWFSTATPLEPGYTPFETQVTGSSPETGGVGSAVIDFVVVPEPAALALLALGLAPGVGRRR